MKKHVITWITMFICMHSIAQNKASFMYETVKHTKSPESVQAIVLSNEVMRSSAIPKKVRSFVNLEVLDLSSRQGLVKFTGGSACVPIYTYSKLKYLPDWIGELQKLKKIDLAGATNINYQSELNKIINLNNLESLRIHPKMLDDELIRVLSKFTNLKSLYIRPVTVTDDKSWVEWLTKLQQALPTCSVETF